jgi:three-Cys-motif partner protein
MADFHKKPFDEGTLTKLDIFELYTREWLPVFLARESPYWNEIHLFDFFCGPGADSQGVAGSPLRTLNVLRECAKLNLAGWSKVQITVHFLDAGIKKIAELEKKIRESDVVPSGVKTDLKALQFSQALTNYESILKASNSAKLLLIDQFGVDEVTPEVFRALVSFPRTDFLFFLSSSTLHRFRDHPAIKQKITRPDDSYHIHRAVLDYYRGLLPANSPYFLAPFSIKKGGNIYGLIFGSGHPKGMDKFLRVAWKKDRLNGEANYDIGRENISQNETYLALDEFRPNKVSEFERELGSLIEAGKCRNEREIIDVCFEHGVTRQHAQPVILRLQREKRIIVDFRVPDIDRLANPRPIQVC